MDFSGFGSDRMTNTSAFSGDRIQRASKTISPPITVIAQVVFQDFRLGDFHDVFRENGEVGQLADFDGAFVLFFEGGVGGPTA